MSYYTCLSDPLTEWVPYIVCYILHYIHASILKSKSSNSLFAVYFSSQQYTGMSGPFTLPCFTICKPHATPWVWTLVFTNANTRLAYVSNTQQLSLITASTFLCLWEPVISDTAACTSVCVCSPTSSVPSHVQCVCTQFYLCALCSVSMLASRLHLIRYMHYIVFAPVHWDVQTSKKWQNTTLE